MATYVLTDLAHDVWVDTFNLDNDAIYLPPSASARSRSAGSGAAGATAST